MSAFVCTGVANECGFFVVGEMNFEKSFALASECLMRWKALMRVRMWNASRNGNRQ